MVKQRYETMGIISPGSPGIYDRQFLKVLGKYGDYAITNVPWLDRKQDLTQRLERDFVPRLSGRIVRPQHRLLVRGHADLRRCHKRAGSTKPEALVEALRQTNLAKRVMIGGAIHFDAKGQNPDQISAAVQKSRRQAARRAAGGERRGETRVPDPGLDPARLSPSRTPWIAHW